VTAPVRQDWATGDVVAADAMNALGAAVNALSVGTATTPVGGGEIDFGFSIGYDVMSLSDATIKAIYANARRAGAKRMRVIISPHNVGSGPYTWTDVDRQVSAVLAAGLIPHMLIEGPRNVGGTAMVVPNAATMGGLAAAAAARYPQCSVWQILNEVNHFSFWGDVPDVSAYAAVLQQCATAIRAAQPNSTILTAGLAACNTVNHNGTDYPGVPAGVVTMSPPDFVTALYAAGAKPYFDHVGVHPYTLETGIDPAAPVPSASSNAFIRDAAVYDVMVTNDDAGKRIWWTEVGFPTVTTTTALGYTITEAQQRDYLKTVFELATARPWVGPVLVYSAQDLGTDTTSPEQVYGVYTNAGVSKAAAGLLSSLSKPLPYGLAPESGGTTTTSAVTVASRIEPGNFPVPYPASDITSLTVDTTIPAYTSMTTRLWNALSGRARISGTLADLGDGSSTGWNMINGATGTSAVTPYRTEFWISGDRFGFGMMCYGAVDYRVLVDGMPVSVAPTTVPYTADALYYWKIQFATSRPRHVEVFLGSQGLKAFYHPGASSMYAANDKRYKVAMTGDSTISGQSTVFVGTVPCMVAMRSGWEIMALGQGGTGYANDGGGTSGRSVYGSSGRMSVLAAQTGLDLMVCYGGANDAPASTFPTATVVAAAQACWSAMKTAQPNVPLIVVGIEPASYLTPPAPTDLNTLNTALKTAAEAHSGVAAFIDIRSDPWVTGSGNSSSPAGDGNADLFIGPDGIHLNAFGADMMAPRLLREIGKVAV